MITIDEGLEIPDESVTFRASRSSGPGGQNVNKVNSRITLEFDLRGSTVFTEDQKNRIANKLRTRINNDGILQVSAQKHRTQSGNREEALLRFAELLRNALREDPPRKKTRVPRAVKEKRLDEKKRAAARKRDRTSLE